MRLLRPVNESVLSLSCSLLEIDCTSSSEHGRVCEEAGHSLGTDVDLQTRTKTTRKFYNVPSQRSIMWSVPKSLGTYKISQNTLVISRNFSFF